MKLAVRKFTKLVLRMHLVILLHLVCICTGCKQAEQRANLPKLIIDHSVASDFEAVIAETWTLFLDVFANRADCFGDVTIEAAKDLPARALYTPSHSIVTIRVPATQSVLQEALIHEWAHHVEFQCETHVAFRSTFLEAAGYDAQRGWFDSSEGWAQTPSERFAQASVVVVLGRQTLPTNIIVTEAEIRAIEMWLAE